MTKSINRGYGQRHLRVEALERRAMLAGNVTVNVTNGNLVVRGDSQDNAVFVTEVDDGVYAVRGFDDLEGTPTDINGVENDVVVLGGVTGDIDIDLKRGDDLLAIGNDEERLIDLIEACGLSFSIEDEEPEGLALLEVVPEEFQTFVPDDLIVRTGDGNDQVALNVAVNDESNINLGQGNDAIAIGGSQFGDDLILNADQGADEVCVLESHVGDLLQVNAGSGNDLVAVGSVRAINSEFTETEMPPTTAGRIRVLGTDGHDILRLFDNTADEVTVEAGSGNDQIAVRSFSIAQELRVIGGSGHDLIRIGGDGEFPDGDGVLAGLLLVQAGSGNDSVNVGDGFNGFRVSIDLGSGNDNYGMGSTQINDRMTLNAGSGNDDIGFNGFEVRGPLSVVAGSGDDDLFFADYRVQSMLVDAGSGHDSVFCDDEVTNLLKLVLGGGNDDVELNTAGVGSLEIDAGSGRDHVIIEDSVVTGNAKVNLGANNDLLRVCNSVAGSALLDGGSGTDELQSDFEPDDLPEGYTVKKFEIFSDCEDVESV